MINYNTLEHYRIAHDLTYEALAKEMKVTLAVLYRALKYDQDPKSKRIQRKFDRWIIAHQEELEKAIKEAEKLRENSK
jgi:hypothetical protein